MTMSSSTSRSKAGGDCTPARGERCRIPPRIGDLVDPASRENRRDRHREDPQIAPQAEVLDVVALDRDPLLQRKVTSSEDLHRPGDARLDAEPDAVLGTVHRE